VYNEGDKSFKGIALGSFTSTTKWPWPNQYNGRVIIIGKDQSTLQQGTKIGRKALADFRRLGGQDWIYHFLKAAKEKRQQQQSASSTES
jgi:hypothetical protein